MNLATEYMGLRLSSPLIVGASPCTDDVQGARHLQDAGASAVVLRSLFEEQVEAAHQPAKPRSSEPLDEYGGSAEYAFSPTEYLRHIEQLKRALSIPVIASLNGHAAGKWTDFCRQLESAGADAIELNFYQVVTDPSIAADQVEMQMLEAVGAIRGMVAVPIAAKLSPYHASVAQLAVALELAGASGIVLFNRFYQPDISVDAFEVQPLLRLSEPGELLLRLRWLAILSPVVRASLCASGGVHTWSGVVKALLAGAQTVQVVSAILKHGSKTLSALRLGLETWMRQMGYSDLDQFRGRLSLARCPDSSAYERANYVRVLQSWKA